MYVNDDAQVRTWWDLKAGDLASAVFTACDRLAQDQSYRSESNLRHARLYSNLAILGLTSSQYAQRAVPLPRNRLTFNIVQSVVDTAQALIATNRPRIQFTTKGGTRKDRELANQLSRFVSGQFYQVGLYDLTPDVFLNAGIFGTGGLKFSEVDGDIVADVVFPEEILVDDVEAKARKPRSLYHVVEMNRAVAKARWPKFRAELDDAEHITDEFLAVANLADPITVIEAWHLPSGKNAKDGRHVICTSNAMLFSEDWDEDCFPFAFWRWNRRPRGFYGQGLAEQLYGIQVEVNVLLQKIQKHMKLASSHIIVKKGSKIAKEKLNNRVFSLIEHVGDKPPIFVTVDPIAAHYFEQLDRLYTRAFEITGVSMLASQSILPEGLKSGEAIRRYNDLQTKRFLAIGQSWEAFHVECAKQLIRLAKRISEREEDGYQVTAEMDDGELVDINWRDLDLDAEAYRMKAWPAGLLPETPAGQVEAATGLAQAFPQLQPHVLRLLGGIPDVQAAISRVTAPQGVMDRIIGNILDGKTYIEPMPYFDLQYGIQEMQLAFAQAVAEEAGDHVLEQMDRWMSQAKTLLDKAAAEAAAKQAAMAQGAMPGGPAPSEQELAAPVPPEQGVATPIGG